MSYIFKRNIGINYNDFCESYGYYNSKKRIYTIDSLKKSWELFYIDNNRFPLTRDYSNFKYNIPDHKLIMDTLGDKKEEFFNEFNKREIEQLHEYFIVRCQELKDYCIKNEYVLGMRELVKNGFQSYVWFVNHSPDNITTYSEFIASLGLKPNTRVTKEIAIKLIVDKSKELGRPLTYDDFRNPKFNEIGISTINKFWGNLNSMLKELGFPINRESMIAKQKTLTELEHNIKELCAHIYKTEDRRNISLEDVENCEWCLHPQTYNKFFKEEYDMTIGEYIKSIGFIPNGSGMGMHFIFDDGEITTSQYEFYTSKYFKDNDIMYNRNIKYKDFIDTYIGNKDCDYALTINNKIWYIEIAGMLDYSKVNINNLKGYHREYKIHIDEKEEMLKSKNLNYKILYPSDFKKPLEEVYSFSFD